jgi:hypothetical protein
MRIKSKTKLFCLFLLFSPLISWAADSGPFSYTPLEKIPGSDTVAMVDFYVYANAIYKFGIWAIGIAALLMITIGGYMYITSAGNNSSMEKAKSVITDAVAGLILALVAYLLLYIINPDLVKIVPLPKVAIPQVTHAPPTGPQGAPGVCNPASSGPCSPANLQAASSCFGGNINKASAICLKESGNSATAPSSTDKCQPGGEPVSWGLFQINLTNHSIGGLNCAAAFSGGPYTSTDHTCVVINRSLYDQCVAAAKNPANNISVACSISSGGANWNQWGANTNSRNGCHF